MRKTRKLGAMMLSLVLLAGSLTACGKAETKDTDTTAATPTTAAEAGTTEATPTTAAETTTEAKAITLKVWGPQEEQTSYEGYGDSLLAFMCERFDEAHPEWDITFTYGAVSEADAKTELTKDAAAGADVFMFASDQTSFLQQNGILAPITIGAEDVIAANGGATAGSISAATFDSLLYAVPFTPNSWFMYYDKSKYTEDDVKSLDTMMAKDLGADAYNFAFDIDNGWYNAAFFFAAGCSLFGADGQNATEVTFNDANGLAVGNYLVDLVTNPKFLEETDQGANAITAFTEGKLGAWCSGTWNAEKVAAALGDNYAATKLPTIKINGVDSQMKSFADYKYIGVNMNTNPDSMEAAQALAVYLGGEECQKDRFIARSIAPTVTSLVSDPEVSANVAVAALSLQSANTQFQSTIPQMGNYWTPAQGFGAGIYNGEITKDNMQEQLDAFVTNVLTALTN
jgi:arabinogalactan oligomer/maltooligosaccharide transport system substrate-binding protein